MWQQLTLSALWFVALFLSGFSKRKTLRLSVAALGVAAAAYFFFLPYVDPWAWAYYLIFSTLVFIAGSRFRRWAFSGIFSLEHRVQSLSKSLRQEKETFEEKTRSTEFVDREASRIARIYEKSKQMSESLDPFETFLVFGEALYQHFQFQEIKLVIFEESAKRFGAQFCYSLNHGIFRDLYDRGVILKDRDKVKSQVFPFDERLFEELAKTMEPVFQESPPVLAYPALVGNQIFGALLVMGVALRDVPLFSILSQRFIAELKRVKLYQNIQEMAITDGLTEVYVRRHLDTRLQDEVARSHEFRRKLSCIMIDVDDFKQFNDRYGHLVGDVVLREAAKTIKANIREIDVVGRYGGEEFCVVLPDTDENGAFFVAERIRRAVAEKSIKAYDEVLSVTLSGGIATFSNRLNDASSLVEAADSALYQAKRQGKNRVCLFTVGGA